MPNDDVLLPSLRERFVLTDIISNSKIVLTISDKLFDEEIGHSNPFLLHDAEPGFSIHSIDIFNKENERLGNFKVRVFKMRGQEHFNNELKKSEIIDMRVFHKHKNTEFIKKKWLILEKQYMEDQLPLDTSKSKISGFLKSKESNDIDYFKDHTKAE